MTKKSILLKNDVRCLIWHVISSDREDCCTPFSMDTMRLSKKLRAYCSTPQELQSPSPE